MTFIRKVERKILIEVNYNPKVKGPHRVIHRVLDVPELGEYVFDNKLKNFYRPVLSVKKDVEVKTMEILVNGEEWDNDYYRKCLQKELIEAFKKRNKVKVGEVFSIKGLLSFWCGHNEGIEFPVKRLSKNAVLYANGISGRDAWGYRNVKENLEQLMFNYLISSDENILFENAKKYNLIHYKKGFPFI
mgnify:CR=1 FL=1